MARRLILATMAVTAALMLGCGKAEPPAPTADEAWDAARAALEATEDREQAIAVLRGYLEEHPVTRRTAGLLGYLVELEGQEAGRPAQTEALVRSIWPQVEDEEQRFELDKLLVTLAALQHDGAKLEVALGNASAGRELTFSDRLELMEGLVAGEAWKETLVLAEGAAGQATVDAYRSDYPDTELSDAEVEEAAQRRQVLVASYRGWAKVNLGQVEEGLDELAAAEPMARRNYVGVPEEPLFKWWGAAVLGQGDAERALELLAADAVMGADEHAMASLRTAYAARFGSEDGLDEYLWSTRDRLAKPLDGFVLADYEGREVAFSDFQGKVILLAFWFPT